MGSAPTQPYINDADFQLYVGDVRQVLRELPAESVHCVVTSPPYWGLRDYGTGTWDGGDADCDHLDDRFSYAVSAKQARNAASGSKAARNVCGKCGATRTDNQLGLEPTPDLFVAAMVDVFREVRRVLRNDGTLWLNLGDSYVAGQGGRQSAVGEMPAAPLSKTNTPRDRDDVDTGAWGNRDVTAKMTPARGTTALKPKDLSGAPWRVAFALQADGWYLRSDIVWSKPNPMPESVTDRPTKAHEYVFLLTKSPRYFFDAEAVREPHNDKAGGPERFGRIGANGGYVESERTQLGGVRSTAIAKGNQREYNPAGRNIRSVWEIATQPYPDAHFATFPEALPERCIKAGTSERGCCPECGAPWVRQTDVEYVKSPVHGSGSVVGRHEVTGANNFDGAGMPRLNKNVTTTGWQPSCGCLDAEDNDPHDPIPCRVLDPFMGSGTTAYVARKLGRRAIGIELNPEYAKLCARRLQQQSLFAGDVA